MTDAAMLHRYFDHPELPGPHPGPPFQLPGVTVDDFAESLRRLAGSTSTYIRTDRIIPRRRRPVSHRRSHAPTVVRHL